MIACMNVLPAIGVLLLVPYIDIAEGGQIIVLLLQLVLIWCIALSGMYIAYAMIK